MENLMTKRMTVQKIKSICFYLLLQVALLVSAPVLYGQDALQKVLDQLPAKGAREEQQLFNELMSTGPSGLAKLTSLVVPNGQDAGVKARYAVSLLTHTVVSPAQKKILEGLYLDALSGASDKEVKAYFLKNLQLVASDASVDKVKPLLADQGENSLVDPALGVLTTLKSEAAKQAILAALSSAPSASQSRIIKALGVLQYAPAATPLAGLITSQDTEVRKQALWALARIADPASSKVMLAQAQQAQFKSDNTEATLALVEYMRGLSAANNAAAAELGQKVLAGTPDASQRHVRLAALAAVTKGTTDKATKLLIAESKRFDTEYQREVLKLATPTVLAGEKAWMKEYKAAKGARQGDLLNLLSDARRSDDKAQEAFFDAQVVPALKSASPETRMAAAERLTLSRNKKYLTPLLDYLMSSADAKDIGAATAAISKLASKDDGKQIAQRLSAADDTHKAALVGLLASKRATDQFNDVIALTSASGDNVRTAAFKALPNVAASNNVDALLKLLSATSRESDVKDVQAAIITSVDEKSAGAILAAYNQEPLKVIPVLPYTPDENALSKVLGAFESGNSAQKQAAFDALTNWPDERSVRPLMNILKNPTLSSFHSTASESILAHVIKSNLPDDQKLLLVREVMSSATDKKQKTAVLRAAGSIRTFLSLVFVSEYLDDAEQGSVASRSAMNIALPSSDGRPGLSGLEVRKILNKMADKLTGADSQYEKIDIMTYLEKMPRVIGYESIFNGKDLSGWQGLVDDPIKRAKMTPAALAKKQQQANAAVSKNWSVKDGMIVFQGDGANLCTIRKYGDFEMLVDWKISKNGDSGIYLRGTPQVQIWDTTRRDVGAQVGSGGLYNNQKNPSKPLRVADNPIGEWNTFHIRMIGDRVWVHLNGILVVDSVVLENFWDRNLPIFPEEAIELQAHGTDLAFRNLYVKELNTKPYQVSTEEQKAGFKPLFDGKTLDNWVGNKTDYIVEGNTIALYPGEKSHGNLYTEKEYSDFILRFEFQLTPGANNGLGIHAPLQGDAAYVGKEIQILDNTSPQYAKLQPYQYHGSVYGILAAKRDYLKPIGEWNEQEVYVKGDRIRVTLNGTVILDGDLKKATANGTADHRDHPGLQCHTGHIGFLGHGSIVRFRNLRINELK